MARNTDIEVYYGDSLSKSYYLVDSANQAVDLTSKVITFYVKLNKSDADSAAVITKAGVNNTNQVDYKGKGTVTLATTDTAITRQTYYWKAVCVEGTLKETIGYGSFVVK